MPLPNLSRSLGELFGEPIPPIRVVKLRGDASTRSYFRVYVRGVADPRPNRLVVMQLPEDAFQSDEGGEQPRSDRLPFLEVADLLASKGLPVPKVWGEDLGNGLILLEDLGDLTLERELRRRSQAEWGRLYGAAIDLLADLHERCGDLPPSSIVARRRFDRALLDWELDHFREWGLEALFGTLGEEARVTLGRLSSSLVGEIGAMPYGFVHRDYQSKNLMLGPGGGLTLIDFQDALLGPRSYDLAALLCDSYVSLELDLQESMIERYAALRHINPTALRREFWRVALHRKLKDAGRFVYIDRVRKNPDFLRWYPQSLVYVGRALRQTPEFAPLEVLLARLIPGFPDAVPEPPSLWE